MELLKSAADALQRHFANVALYLGVAFFLSLTGSALDIVQLLQNPDPDAQPTLASSLVRVFWFTLYSAALAFVQCVVFSRIGREIDRPLWKVRDDRDAFQRFFIMWFEFNWAVNTIAWIAGTPLGGDGLEAVNILALLVTWLLAIVVVPFGTCQMFLGSFSWSTFTEGLGAIGRRPAEFLPVFAITALQLPFGFYIFALSRPQGAEFGELALMTAARGACDIAIAYLDCLVFAATWLACKYDRDSPDEIDLDF